MDGESELDAYAPLPGNIFFPSDMRPFIAEEPHDYDKAAATAGIDITWKDGLPYMPDGSQFDLLRNLTYNVDKLLEACSKALYVTGGTAAETDSDSSDDSEFIEIDLDDDDPLNVEN